MWNHLKTPRKSTRFLAVGKISIAWLFLAILLGNAEAFAGSGYYAVVLGRDQLPPPPNRTTTGPGTTRTVTFSQDTQQSTLGASVAFIPGQAPFPCDFFASQSFVTIASGSDPSSPPTLIPVRLSLAVSGYAIVRIEGVGFKPISFQPAASGIFQLMLPTNTALIFTLEALVFPQDEKLGCQNVSYPQPSTVNNSSVSATINVGKGLCLPLPGDFEPCIEKLEPPLNLRTTSGSVDPTFAAVEGIGSTVVRGVASDGISQVVLRIRGRAFGENISVTVGNLADSTTGGFTPSNSVDDDGALALLDGSTAFSSTLEAVPTNDHFNGQPVAYVVYRAPINTPKEVEVSKLIQVDAKNSATVSTQMLVLAPPVVLIHGLWSGPSAWDALDPSLSAGSGLGGFQVCPPVDYEDTNSEGIDRNVQVVLPQIMRCSRVFREVNNVAQTGVDIVAHSMGGLVVRRMATFRLFANSDTYGQGFIHKLITLDTPHLGSELANRLSASNAACKGAFAGFHKPVSGAIEDLRTDSGLVRLLQAPSGHSIATHAIAAVANDAQKLGIESSWSLQGVLTVCPSLLDQGSFDSTFGEPNDLIVGQRSEEAVGLGAAFLPVPNTSVSGLIHAVDKHLFTLGPSVLSLNVVNEKIVPVPTAIPSLINTLLSAPLDHNIFTPILP